MKRRSVAVILGLVMAVSPVNAFASESVENAETEITESTEFISDEAEAIVGKVLSVGEDSVTIAEGMIPDAAIAGQDDTEVPESTADGTEREEASGKDTDDSDKDADEAKLAQALELTGEERTVAVTADTRISRMYLETEAEDGEIVSGTEAPESEETAGDEAPVSEETEDDVNVELFIDDEAAGSGELELSDVREGHVVSVTMDEDGNAAELLVWQYGGYTDGAEIDSEAGIELVLDDTEEGSTDSESTDTENTDTESTDTESLVEEE